MVLQAVTGGATIRRRTLSSLPLDINPCGNRMKRETGNHRVSKEERLAPRRRVKLTLCLCRARPTLSQRTFVIDRFGDPSPASSSTPIGTEVLVSRGAHCFEQSTTMGRADYPTSIYNYVIKDNMWMSSEPRSTGCSADQWAIIRRKIRLMPHARRRNRRIAANARTGPGVN